MRRRTRDLPFSLGRGRTRFTQYYVNGGSGPPPPSGDSTVSLGTIYGSQITDSETHHWPARKGSTGDVGGEFFTQKKYVDESLSRPIYVRAVSNQNVVSPTMWRDTQYNGPIWPLPPSLLQFPAAKISSDLELNKLGTDAIARCKPSNAVINLATFLAELAREGVPRVPFKEWKAGTDRARQSGDQFLNLEYGWKPIVNDLRAVASQIDSAERIFAQYERDAGRTVRRRYEFPIKRESSFLSWTDFASGYYAPANTDLNRAGRSFTVSRLDESTTKTWFSGAFVYHLPKDWRPVKEMGEANRKLSEMFTVELTPETVWNLIPWTWATDWFGNVGDILSNVTDWANDGLVMRYGYLMQHNVVKSTYTLHENRPLWGMTPGAVSKITLVTETKLRKRANPYGFGVSWDGLTAVQAAILAALGITRVPR